jgi:acyl transferase domain-containing protein
VRTDSVDTDSGDDSVNTGGVDTGGVDTGGVDTVELRGLMEEQLRLSRRLKARIRELEGTARAPLAVIGMALRFPAGLRSPEEYWNFLCGDGIAVSEIPPDRPGLRVVLDPRPGRPGRSYVDRAAFLDDIEHFDADFFGISQREAELLDPQQRLLLETAWEALERAGIAVRRSDRLDVGVYLGMMASEYAERLAVRDDKTPLDPYYATGGGLCFGAGRISYVMGFRGPVVSVDTACSSSLTALHLAVRALRGRECRYALVCGSNLVLSANLMVSLCQSRALSPQGRSKAFLATADGYGRGEGVGVVALMRLDDAEREGRPILAVVRGTAINHDGPASGLTVPNGPAQSDVIRAALADGGVEAGDLGWVEAHGTGTLLGDPTEVGALDGAVGAAVRERGIPLALGSVKARLNHLEAASGVAALIKTVLMLHHGEIPAAARVEDGELNPYIPWDRFGFTVPRHRQPWPADLPRRVAGVNSFGMSGTNAHAVLEAYAPASATGAPEAPGVPGRGGADMRPELLTLSAKDPDALADLVDVVVRYLKGAGPAMTASICHTLRVGRVPFAHRLAVTGATPAVLAERLVAALQVRAGAAAAPARVPRVRAVTVRVAPQPEPLAAALAALADSFPLLDAALARAPADSAQRLGHLVGLFGPQVELRRDAGPAADPARLEWDGGACPLVGAGAHTAAAEELLDALARLFVAGADLRLDKLRAPDARLLADLPTYPFRRRRFWIDEPAGTPGGTGSEAGPPRPDAAPATAAPIVDRADLEAYLMAELKDALHATEELDGTRSFLEAGGDSFISTLYITRIEERFTVEFNPEDLPVELPLSVLIGRLADHITELAGDSAEEPTA